MLLEAIGLLLFSLFSGLSCASVMDLLTYHAVLDTLVCMGVSISSLGCIYVIMVVVLLLFLLILLLISVGAMFYTSCFVCIVVIDYLVACFAFCLGLWCVMFLYSLLCVCLCFFE